MKEISRQTWPKFFKTFNSTNQYRQVNVSIVDKRQGESNLVSNMPFLGIKMAKEGRTVGGLRLYAGRWDSEKLNEPILSIQQPAKVLLEKNGNENDRLRIITKDGAEAHIDLYGEKGSEQPRALVEKVAYSIYEKRGYAPGNDMGDWFQAEKILKETEEQLTE
jgi:hypothetical protein